MSKKRGCGTRVKGGIYAETPLSPFGQPLEAFLLEPPRDLADFEGLGVSPIGVKMLELDGTWHVLDWVGSQHYPHVADFVEELRALGLSRRLPKTLDFQKLGPGSRMILIHSEAIIDPWEDAWERDTAEWVCPMVQAKVRAPELEHPEGQCIGSWWHDLRLDAFNEFPHMEGNEGTRELPCEARYHAWVRPDNTDQGSPIERRPGVFAMLPINHIAVIHDDEDGTHQEGFDKASEAALPVELEEE